MCVILCDLRITRLCVYLLVRYTNETEQEACVYMNQNETFPPDTIIDTFVLYFIEIRAPRQRKTAAKSGFFFSPLKTDDGKSNFNPLISIFDRAFHSSPPEWQYPIDSIWNTKTNEIDTSSK